MKESEPPSVTSSFRADSRRASRALVFHGLLQPFQFGLPIQPGAYKAAMKTVRRER